MKDRIYIRDFVAILLKYKLMMLVILSISTGFFFEMSSFMQKKYKSSFTINVYSKYFKNPLISEVVPGVYSIQEMRQTIDSMAKEAINDNFIDYLGKKYHIYKGPLTEYELTKQRMFFRDNVRMFSDGGQSYKVSFVNSDPMVTYKVAQELLEKIRTYFINSRIETIEYVKSIMAKKIQSLSVREKLNKSEISDNALASKNPDILQAELNKLDHDISALKKQFNIYHPKVQKLLIRKKTIEAWLGEYRNKSKKAKSEDPLILTNNKEVAANISSRLYTKYYDTNMALDLEKRSVEKYIGILHAPQIPIYPIWPKKRLFASIGILVGLMICFIYIFVKEVMVPPVELKMQELAVALECEFLGVIPTINFINEGQVTTSAADNKHINKIGLESTHE